MTMLKAVGSALVALLFAADLLAANPGGIDVAEVQTHADPAVCLVTVQNSLGITVAYASGFLLGKGRFVITDLAAVTQPDATRATVRFQDGSMATSTQFGLANPSIGLAAIHLGDTLSRAGLTLSSEPIGPSPLPVVLFGWQWGHRLANVVGRLGPGQGTADLAARLGVAPPAETWGFLFLTGGTLPGASGAPILDQTGAVLGITLLLASRNTTLLTVVPSDVMHGALLSAKPELKPFADLPKPLWPVQVFRVAGDPPGAAEFAQLVETTKTGLVCKRCGGKGTIVEGIYGRRRPCPGCNGEKIACPSAAATQLAQFAAQGARFVHVPGQDERARRTSLAAGGGLLQAIAKAEEGFRTALVRAPQMGLGRAGFPKGLVVYARVRDTFQAPDGRYTILVPAQGGSDIAVRSDALPAAAPEKADDAPAPGDWVVLAGLAAQTFSVESDSMVYLVPFLWVDAPDFGEGPVPPPRPRRPGPPDAGDDAGNDPRPPRGGGGWRW